MNTKPGTKKKSRRTIDGNIGVRIWRNQNLISALYVGEYTFKDKLSYDICPVCGWEEYGAEDEPDEEPTPYFMTLNERKAWFAKQRELNPKFLLSLVEGQREAKIRRKLFPRNKENPPFTRRIFLAWAVRDNKKPPAMRARR